MRVLTFISFRKRKKQNYLAIENINFSTKINPNLTDIYTFHPRKAGKKYTVLSRFVQSGVPPRRGNRKFSSALSNSDFQFVHVFRGKHASTSCLSCDSASLRIQFPPLWDAEAEFSGKLYNDSIIRAQKMGKMTAKQRQIFYGK